MDDEMTEGCEEMIDNVYSDGKPIQSLHGIAVFDDDCIIEPICEISECNLKEEEAFHADLGISNTGDIHHPPLKRRREFQKNGEEKLSSIACQQDIEKEIEGASTCKFQTKKIAIVLKRIDSIYPKYKNSNNAGERLFWCGVCAEPFSQRRSLKKHLRTHATEKPFTCDVCAASYRRRDHLISHIPTHTGEKSFACDVCDALFSRKSDLNKHLRIHTKDKPFSCDVCVASFRRRDHLKDHMLTHTEQKPFVCDVCGASFAQKSNLKKHLRTHTKEKPFLCELCAASFSRGDHLKNHLRTHK